MTEPNDAKEIAREHLAVSGALMSKLAGDEDLLDAVAAAADALVEALDIGCKILFFGNGGSAADSQHLAAELTGRFKRERKGLPAIALTTDTSALTAIANDFGYDEVFRRQVEALGRAGDVAVGLSTSGGSESVLRGIRQAAESGLTTVAITGAAGGRIAPAAAIAIKIPSDITAHIQEATIAVGHVLCEAIDRAFA